MDTVFMEEMTWQQIEHAMQNGVDSVLIPLAAMEQHGPHLPIFTDTWLGYALCGPIASKVGGMLVAPPVYPGRSEHHMAFPGTISLSSETFKAVVREYCVSLARHGFKNLVFVATHGGNFKAMAQVLPEIQAQLPDTVVISVTGEQSGVISQQVNVALGLDSNKCGRHAGLTETSMLLATCPELVHMEWAVEGWVGGYGADFTEKLEEGGMQAFSQFGILGDPRESTAEDGARIIEGRAQGYAAVIRQMLGKTDVPAASDFPEIHRMKLDQKLLLEQMTSKEIAEALASGYDTVFIMLGATEQHGPHLPLGTDTMLGYERGVRLARRLGNALVAPVIRPGLSEHHMHFPGTITLQPETFKQMVFEFCTTLATHGFRNLILVPTHGGNYEATEAVCPEIAAALPGVRVLLLGRDESRAAHGQIQPKLNVQPEIAGVHAGLTETALMLVYRPELVHMEKAQAGWVGQYDAKAAAQLSSSGMQSLSDIGVLGDPRGSTAELGNAYLDAWTEIYAAVVSERLKPS